METNNQQKAAFEILRRRRAGRSIVEFAEFIDVPGRANNDDEDCDIFTPIESGLAEHHKMILREVYECAHKPFGRLMIFMPPGSAKALALDTPIPTPTGWTVMGALKIGDEVFDENGKPCKVTWVSPIHRNRPVYKVTTDCGDTIVADKDHEWLVRLCGKKRKALLANGRGRPALVGRDDPATKFKIKETWELAKDRAKRPMVQRAGALDTLIADLPIDPYLLGVWLGDGTSASMSITSSDEDRPWLRAEIERLGYETSDRSATMLFGVLGVRDKFVKMNLINDPAHNTYGSKHIPLVYLRASVDQRMALLQGLIDTDGTVCKKRGCTTFCNTDKSLAKQVRELVRSLGVKAGWSESVARLNGKDCGTAYKVSFYLEGSARMPRKAALCRNQTRTPNTYIDVEPCGIADTVCIEVNSPSHLFLCGQSMTPTHNSTYASVVAPAFLMGETPKWRCGLFSYGSSLAKKMGRRTRSIINQPRYKGSLKAELSGDAAAVDNFTLTNGSEYMATGILGAATGNRFEMLMIDDPVKGREDADSETIRDKTWSAFQDDLKTRLVPGGSICIIQTRWHEDDLSGRILPTDWNGESGDILCQDGEVWRVLCLQAQCETDTDPLGRKQGEYLWPEWFTERHWNQFRNDARTWGSLCQQLPKPKDGNLFKPDKLVLIPHLPEERIIWVRGWDLSACGGGAYTAGLKMGKYFRNGTERIVIAHVLRKNDGGPDGRDAAIKRTVQLDGRSVRQDFPDDPGAAGTVQITALVKLLKGFPVIWSPESGDKETRALPFASYVNAGLVDMVVGEWNRPFVNEMRSFPNGTYMDQVDAGSRAFARLMPAQGKMRISSQLLQRVRS